MNFSSLPRGITQSGFAATVDIMDYDKGCKKRRKGFACLGCIPGRRQPLEKGACLCLHGDPEAPIVRVTQCRQGYIICSPSVMPKAAHYLKEAVGTRCYLGGAARCSCGTAYMIQGLDRICVFCCCYPPIRPALPCYRFKPSRTCGHSCLHLTALGWTFPVEPILRHKFYVEGWSGV